MLMKYSCDRRAVRTPERLCCSGATATAKHTEHNIRKNVVLSNHVAHDMTATRSGAASRSAGAARFRERFTAPARAVCSASASGLQRQQTSWIRT